MNKGKILHLCVYFILIPAVIMAGIRVFEDRKYAYISMVVTILSCAPFFHGYEKGTEDTGRLVLLSVLTALAVIGRAAFAFLPGFKPVTAVVIITGMYLGAESGFMCGALSAVLSNMMFGQGPWTPLQMFSWGMIGFLAGIFSKILIKRRIVLFGYAAFSGVLFSLLMDLWSVLWQDGFFAWKRYAALIITAVPTTVKYAAANVIFMLLLAKPFGEKLLRMKQKYNI